MNRDLSAVSDLAEKDARFLFLSANSFKHKMFNGHPVFNLIYEHYQTLFEDFITRELLCKNHWQRRKMCLLINMNLISKKSLGSWRSDQWFSKGRLIFNLNAIWVFLLKGWWCFKWLSDEIVNLNLHMLIIQLNQQNIKGMTECRRAWKKEVI